MQKKNIVTPATIALFLAISISGIMLFYHLKSNWVHEAHEWIGMAFVIAALWHATMHWRSVKGYVKRRVSVVVLALFVLGSIGVIVGTSSPATGGPRAVLEKLSHQPIRNIAAAFSLPPEEMLAQLKAEGINATADTLLDEAANQAHRPAFMLLTKLTESVPAPAPQEKR